MNTVEQGHLWVKGKGTIQLDVKLELAFSLCRLLHFLNLSSAFSLFNSVPGVMLMCGRKRQLLNEISLLVAFFGLVSFLSNFFCKCLRLDRCPQPPSNFSWHASSWMAVGLRDHLGGQCHLKTSHPLPR